MYSANHRFHPNQLQTMHNSAQQNRGFPMPNNSMGQGREMYNVHPDPYSHATIRETDEEPLDEDFSDPGQQKRNYYNLSNGGLGQRGLPPTMMDGFHQQRSRMPLDYQQEQPDPYVQGGFYHQNAPYMPHDPRLTGGYGGIPTQPYEQDGSYSYGRPVEKVPSPNKGALNFKPPSKNPSPSLPTPNKKNKTPHNFLLAENFSQDNEENNSVPSRKSSQDEHFDIAYNKEKSSYQSKKSPKREQRGENSKTQKHNFQNGQKGDYSYPENHNYSKKTKDEDERSIKEACRDWSKQSSSRHLQQLLTSESEQVIHSIVSELIKQFYEMSMNIFGNYVAQKMIEAGRQSSPSLQTAFEGNNRGGRLQDGQVVLQRVRVSCGAQTVRHPGNSGRESAFRVRGQLHRNQPQTYDSRPERQLHSPEASLSSFKVPSKIYCRLFYDGRKGFLIRVWHCRPIPSPAGSCKRLFSN
jgi:hypothetical protein